MAETAVIRTEKLTKFYGNRQAGGRWRIIELGATTSQHGVAARAVVGPARYGSAAYPS